MHRTGRSPLFQQLRRTFHAARLDNFGLKPPLPARKRFRPSRRRFLAGAAGGLLGALYAGSARARTNGPRIAVVGAGIAGLHATYLLQRAGFDVTLYEGSRHVGGRIQTDVGSVAPNVYTELGGEFIDSTHEDMLNLANHFDFDLIDTFDESEDGLKVAYYADGKLRSEEEVIRAFKPLARIIDDDFNQTSDDVTFDSHSSFDRKLDRTNLRDYLKRNNGVDWLHEVLEAAYVNEFGLELKDQSSFNFVWTIGTGTSDGFAVYGESDQRYKIRGGNQQIVDALADAVGDHINFGHRLQELSLRSGGAYRLTFDRPHESDRTVEFDLVILTIPFTVLRNIELHVPLPDIKKKAIRELGYGINAKLILGFQNKFWRHLGYSGDAYVDLPYQSGWDASRLQEDDHGAYTIYPGGNKAADLRHGSEQDQAKRLLPGLNKAFPGVKDRWLGTALRAYWPSNPYVLGSYSAYMPGQWTGIRGAEPTPVGNLYFAGEHTSLDWQGYMNGGAESGRFAAEAIIG